ncbi:MAG: FHA domain-containing protein [Deltaproteobacteria bacterium]|nr:FHA domain-containing protein [Deltaproteobacteria bacterium]
MSANGQGGAGIELVLTAGRSNTERVQFTAAVAATRAMVGAAATADWSIAAPGLDPQHAEIAWDGTAMWVRDNGSRSGSWVGGERLTQEWRVLAVGEVLRLGQAQLTTQGVGAGSGEREEFEDEATQISGGGAPRAPSSDRDDGESTMIVNTADVPVRPATLAPRVKAATSPPKINAANMPPSAPNSNVATLVQDDGGMLAAYAQQMAAQHNSASVPGYGQPQGAPVNPFGMAPSSASTAMYPSPAYPSHGGDFGPAAGEMSLFGSIPPPEAGLGRVGQKDKKLSEILPPRTAILLGVAIIASLGVGLMPAPEPPAPVARPVPPELLAPQPAWRPAIPGESVRNGQPVLLRVSAAPVVPPAPERPARRPPPPPPQTAEQTRQAADLLLQNRPREAMVIYQALLAAHPAEPVYRDMLMLLQRRLEATACPPGSPSGCTGPAPLVLPPLPVEAAPVPVPVPVQVGQTVPVADPSQAVIAPAVAPGVPVAAPPTAVVPQGVTP